MGGEEPQSEVSFSNLPDEILFFWIPFRGSEQRKRCTEESRDKGKIYEVVDDEAAKGERNKETVGT